jgi:hypothetical protein
LRGGVDDGAGQNIQASLTPGFVGEVGARAAAKGQDAAAGLGERKAGSEIGDLAVDGEGGIGGGVLGAVASDGPSLARGQADGLDDRVGNAEGVIGDAVACGVALTAAASRVSATEPLLLMPVMVVATVAAAE